MILKGEWTVRNGYFERMRVISVSTIFGLFVLHYLKASWQGSACWRTLRKENARCELCMSPPPCSIDVSFYLYFRLSGLMTQYHSRISKVSLNIHQNFDIPIQSPSNRWRCKFLLSPVYSILHSVDMTGNWICSWQMKSQLCKKPSRIFLYADIFCCAG